MKVKSSKRRFGIRAFKSVDEINKEIEALSELGEDIPTELLVQGEMALKREEQSKITPAQRIKEQLVFNKEARTAYFSMYGRKMPKGTKARKT